MVIMVSVFTAALADLVNLRESVKGKKAGLGGEAEFHIDLNPPGSCWVAEF